MAESKKTKKNTTVSVNRDEIPQPEKQRSGTSKGTASQSGKNRSNSGKYRVKDGKANKKKDERQKSTTVPSVVALVLIFAGLIVAICLILNALCNFNGELGDPSEHFGSYFGFYFCMILIAMFGCGSVLIPIALFFTAVLILIKKERKHVITRAILSASFITVVSALGEIIYLTIEKADGFSDFGILERFQNYADLTLSGGIVGGGLGYLMYGLMGAVLAIITSVLLILLLGFLVVGLSPEKIAESISSSIKARREDADRQREKKEKQKEKEQRKEEARRLRAERKAEAEAEKKAEKDSVREAAKAAIKAAKEAEGKKNESDTVTVMDGNTALEVDKTTGEVINETAPNDGSFVPLDLSPEEKEKFNIDDNSGSTSYGEDTSNIVSSTAMNDYSDNADETEDGSVHRNGYGDPSIEVNKIDDGTPEPDYYTTLTDDEKKAEQFFPREGSEFKHNNDTENDNNVFDEANDGDKSTDYSQNTVDNFMHQFFDGEDEDDEAEQRYLDELAASLENEKPENDVPAVPEEPPYVFPPLDLLHPANDHYAIDRDEVERNKRLLRETLESFKVKIKDIGCSCGPTLTRYEIVPEAGVRVRSIAGLSDDIALRMSSKTGVRIEAPIPGKPAVGVEVANDHATTVYLRTLLETPDFQNHKSYLASGLGVDVIGNPVIFNIEKMPHLLIAGTTGSGKSVCINSMILSIMYKSSPDEVKFILIDPKKVEFTVYRDIPHLYAPIITDPKKAAGALASAVNEMERRFELIEQVGMRNITGYNEITKNDPDMPHLPRIVIIIDEFADLMMTASQEVETAVCRIAQKARAAGIHLIIGTQRPSADVITGLIKANIPSKIACKVASRIDSGIILDSPGAEKLIGYGDMLYAPSGCSKPQRLQGAFVSDTELLEIIEYVKAHNAPVKYDDEFSRMIEIEAAKCGKKAGSDHSDYDDMQGSPDGSSGGDEDSKLWQALELAVETGKISTSLLQRKIGVGYGRGAKIMDTLEDMGFIGPADGNKPRKILVTRQQLIEMKMNNSQPKE